MAKFIKAGVVSDIPSGSIKSFVVEGKNIAIAHLDGEFFAISDMCSHAQCSLGNEGFVEGKEVVCGCHGSKFDIASGKVLSLPATTDIATYQVKIEGDAILVSL